MTGFASSSRSTTTKSPASERGVKDLLTSPSKLDAVAADIELASTRAKTAIGVQQKSCKTLSRNLDNLEQTVALSLASISASFENWLKIIDPGAIPLPQRGTHGLTQTFEIDHGGTIKFSATKYRDFGTRGVAHETITAESPDGQTLWALSKHRHSPDWSLQANVVQVLPEIGSAMFDYASSIADPRSDGTKKISGRTEDETLKSSHLCRNVPDEKLMDYLDQLRLYAHLTSTIASTLTRISLT